MPKIDVFLKIMQEYGASDLHISAGCEPMLRVNGVLEKAKLIQRKKEGRVHRFIVNPEPIRAAMSWVEQHQRFWEQQLAALGRYLETTNNKESKK